MTSAEVPIVYLNVPHHFRYSPNSSKNIKFLTYLFLNIVLLFLDRRALINAQYVICNILEIPGSNTWNETSRSIMVSVMDLCLDDLCSIPECKCFSSLICAWISEFFFEKIDCTNSLLNLPKIYNRNDFVSSINICLLKSLQRVKWIWKKW